MAKRTFTKYPSGYVGASTETDTQYAELSEDELKELVRQYRDSGAAWASIVDELQGTYGPNIAKAVADAVGFWRIWRGF